jgi:hypothetical protein
MQMHCVILLFVTCLTVPYFSTFSYKQHDFWKKKLWTCKVCLFSQPLLSERFLILRRIQRDFIINVQTPSCKVRDIRVRYWLNLNFLNRILKRISDIKFHKTVSHECWIVPSGWTFRQTDKPKLMVAFTILWMLLEMTYNLSKGFCIYKVQVSNVTHIFVCVCVHMCMCAFVF